MNQKIRLPGVARPPVSISIIGLCALVFALEGMYRVIPASLALWPVGSGRFDPWQLVSYGFLHGSFNHIFFNMFAVWMFGLQVERALGSRRFTAFYLVCMVGAAFVQLIVQAAADSVIPTVGASGAVFGLLLAYGVLWPNNRILLIFFPGSHQG